MMKAIANPRNVLGGKSKDWAVIAGRPHFIFVPTFYQILYWCPLTVVAAYFTCFLIALQVASVKLRSWKLTKVGDMQAMVSVHTKSGVRQKTVETTGARRPCATFDFAQSCRVCDNMLHSCFACAKHTFAVRISVSLCHDSKMKPWLTSTT